MISAAEIRRIAALANLELTPEEVAKFAHELSDILDFFSALQEVNTEGVEPTAQITGLKNITGADTKEDCACSEALLNSAPNPIQKDQIAVKAVFEE